MEQKTIGIIIIIFGIIIAGLVYFSQQREERYISNIINETGSCYLSDGTCLHDDRDKSIYVFGWALSIALVMFGIYLGFVDKTQKVLTEHQIKVSAALGEAKKSENEKSRFDAFIAGFTSEEQVILKAIKEQDGITQSTLRYRTGMTKTSLSLILSSLEKREIISRKESGKTKEVYLRKKF